MNYIEGILRIWQSNNFKSLADIENYIDSKNQRKIEKNKKLDDPTEWFNEKITDLSTYEIKNNTNLKNKSKVVITVTAENGDTKDYTITIKKSSNFGLILIILILLGICGYVMYKLVTKMPAQKENILSHPR